MDKILGKIIAALLLILFVSGSVWAIIWLWQLIGGMI